MLHQQKCWYSKSSSSGHPLYHVLKRMLAVHRERTVSTMTNIVCNPESEGFSPAR